MNQMQAGLPNQVDRSIMSVAQLGDMKPLSVAAKLAFIDDSGYWLKSGVLLAWDSKFNALMKNHKGLCITEYPTNLVVSIPNSPTWHKQFYAGGNYVYVGGDASNNSNNYARAGVTTAVATDRKADLTANGLASQTAVQLGVNVIVVGTSGGSNVGAMTSASGGVWSAVTGPAAADSFKYAASNNSNLMMIVKGGVGMTTANAIYTSTNGTSATGRTGTGAAQVCHGAYWSPCSAAFLTIGTTSLFKAADGFTFSTPTLPADVTSMASPFVTNDYTSRYCASSATSTVIMLSDGRLLRTTDGTNFTSIDPLTNYTACVVADRFIFHDGTKYIMCINYTQSNLPAFMISIDDGLTWVPSVSWASTSVAVSNETRFGKNVPCVANGLTLWAVPQVTTSPLDRMWDVTGMISTTVIPTKVGLMANVGTPTQYVKVA